jgi:hypothetical protein
MKAKAGQSVSFDPGTCCGRRDYEYRTGGTRTRRKDVIIEAWVIQRCIHCHRSFRMLAYAKLAGDEDATGRQYRHRASKQKKFATPSTGIIVRINENAPVA